MSSSTIDRRSRILVVDDEPFNRDLLVQELEMYETAQAASGDEALRAVAADPPDLILLDIMMPPGIDGYEVCRRLKSDDATRFIPIVIMTALSAVEDRIRGIDAGADDFLTKPADNRELMARIRTALRAKHSLDRKLDVTADRRQRVTPTPVGGIRACTRCGAVYSIDLPKCSIDGNTLALFDRDPLIGRRIDRYDILDRTGAGGMGCVYVASHATLKRQRYAVKIPFGELAVEREHAERFFREAEAIASLDHPNVVSVLDFGSTPEGLPYMVMEFLQGKTLREILKETGALPGPRAATIARQMASGLAHAHSRSLVHRDIKPANVMIQEHDGEDVVKLLDFGVAGSLAGGDRHTQRDVRVGTPLYMAPEQLETGVIGPSSDLYALGISMYEMISGVAPFSGDHIKVYADKLSAAPAMLPSTTGLERLTWSLLQPDPKARPASARDVIDQLDDLIDLRSARRSQKMAAVPREESPAVGPEDPTKKPV